MRQDDLKLKVTIDKDLFYGDSYLYFAITDREGLPITQYSFPLWELREALKETTLD